MLLKKKKKKKQWKKGKKNKMIVLEVQSDKKAFAVQNLNLKRSTLHKPTAWTQLLFKCWKATD